MVYKAVEFLRKPSAMRSAASLHSQRNIVSSAPRILAMAGLALGCCWPWRCAGGAAPAQSAAKPGTEAAPQAVPGFWDPRRRPDRPDLSRLTVIRFLTETDYPPFNFTGPDGNPAGFNVDLARLLCEEIKVTCTIQMRRFETLLDAISSNRGDAIIASLAVTPQTARPGRFHRSLLPGAGAVRVAARRRDGGDSPRISRGQEGRRHRRLLARGLSEGDVHRRRTACLSQRRGAAAGACGAARSISSSATRSRWRSGSTAPIPANCCAFSGGPFVESRYFGEGIGIAVRKGNDLLRQALNWALFRVWEKGRYTDLWLRYFSVSPF